MIQRNSVPDQNADNFLKLTVGETGCCGDSAIDCKNTATYVQANSVSLLNATINGVATALPLVIAGAATAATAKAAILATLIAAGYYDDENPDVDGVTVTDTGTDLVVVVTGNISLISLTTSGGAVNFTKVCNIVNRCTFAEVGFTAGGVCSLKINGASYTLGTITPGTTSGPTVKTAVDNALIAAGVAQTLTTVVVNGAGAAQTYDISITGVLFETTMYAVGASLVPFYFQKTACAQVYE